LPDIIRIGDPIKEDEIDGACEHMREKLNAYEVMTGNLKETDRLKT
jgi:hypothetical protein